MSVLVAVVVIIRFDLHKGNNCFATNLDNILQIVVLESLNWLFQNTVNCRCIYKYFSYIICPWKH